MEMEAFETEVRAAVKEGLGSSYIVELTELHRNNGITRHGLAIVEQGRNVAPTICLEDFLEAHVSGMPFREVVRQVVGAYRRSVPGDDVDMGFFRSFEKVRDRICFRLVGKKENERMLAAIPCIEFLDLAICFYYAYQGSSLGEGSILIHDFHIGMWDTCTTELFGLAKRNTPKLFPWRCWPMDEVLAEMAGGGAGQADLEALPGIPLRVLSNAERVHGAACILYPGVLEALAQEEGGGFYILPSSVHEVLLLPDRRLMAEPKELRQMIAEVNSTHVAPEEVLSDSLYYYDAADKRVRVV